MSRTVPPVIEVGQLLAIHCKGDRTVTLRASTQNEEGHGYVVRVDGPDGEWTYRQHWQQTEARCWADFERAAGLTPGGWALRRAVYHPEMGVFLGEAMGMGFWSKLDAVGQTEAVVFETVGKARDFIDSLKVDGRTKDRCGIYPVIVEAHAQTDTPHYATIEQIEAAGLPRWEPTDHTPVTDAKPVDARSN